MTQRVSILKKNNVSRNIDASFLRQKKCCQKKFVFLAAFLSLFFTSCASMGMSNADYLSLLDSGDYAECFSYLKAKNSKKVLKRDAIRNYYDAAMLLHYQKKYDESLTLMNLTDRMMDDAVTKSISKGFASYFVNDTVTDYAGNPYEYTYINIFNALNYYAKGDIEEAAVEVRRLNEKQQKFLNDYGEWLKRDFSEKKSTEVSYAYNVLKFNDNSIKRYVPEKATEDDIFRDSPTARYLSIVFGMMDDSVNNSWNIRADSEVLHALNPSFAVEEETKITDEKGRLDVLAFTGLIGRRGEKRIVIGPIPGLIVESSQDKRTVAIPEFDLEFVYPVFPPPTKPNPVLKVHHADSRPDFELYPGSTEVIPFFKSKVESVEVLIEGQEKKLALLEDFNYAVQKDVNSKARKAFNKSLSRSIVKKASAITGASVSLYMADGVLAENTAGDLGFLFAYLAAVSAIDQVDKTELADIRQVYTLPARAYAGGIELDPGKYSFTLRYYDARRNLLKEEKFTSVEIKKGKTTLVEATCQI